MGHMNSTCSLYGQRNSHIEAGSVPSCVIIGQKLLSAWVLGVGTVGGIESYSVPSLCKLGLVPSG